MRAMHRRYPIMPFLIVGKEISLEDVRLSLEKLPDRFIEHPSSVIVITNLYYAEAPWLRPRDVKHAAALNWREVALEGSSSYEYGEQLRGLDPFLVEGLAGQVEREDRQPDVRSAVGRRDLSQGSLVPARQRDSEARSGRRQLRSRDRLAAVARAHERPIQGQQGARAAGAQHSVRRAGCSRFNRAARIRRSRWCTRFGRTRSRSR